MGAKTPQTRDARAWELAARQHGVVARRQLLALGFSARAITHRLATGRLHLVYRGVYVVGRPQLTRHGRWMAAVLACGPDAALSHETAATLWGIRPHLGVIELSVPATSDPRPRGLRVHRRSGFGPIHVTSRHNVPLTNPTRTLLDLAIRLDRAGLERAINEADRLELVDTESLREALGVLGGQSGVRVLRRLLDDRTFRLTDSELERRFIPIALRAGLGTPLTQQHLNGFRVDFFWPEAGLVVETDGLRYHRTPGQQSSDRLRDQVHTAAGLTPLRFTHAQVRYEPGHVERVLAAVMRRLIRRGSA